MHDFLTLDLPFSAYPGFEPQLNVQVVSNSFPHPEECIVDSETENFRKNREKSNFVSRMINSDYSGGNNNTYYIDSCVSTQPK